MEIIIRDKDFKHKTALSPSRIDKYLNCSALYAATYLYKIPDYGNSGSKRGSVTHDVLEVLHNGRHKDKIDSILSKETCKHLAGVWRLVVKYAKKYGVNNEDDLDLIDKFIYVGLKTDFFGPPDTVKIYSEKTFDFEVEGKGISYRLRGFIDRSFIIKRGNNLYIKISDWKTSKSKYKPAELLENNQAICYQLAVVRYLFPDIKMDGFDFIFVKFPKSPVVAVELSSNNALRGYEYWLTEIQSQIDKFTEADASTNYAALKADKSWLCGKEGFKKDGSVNFICSARKPFDYYVLLDKDKKILDSKFKESELKPKDGQIIEKRYYPGCSYYYKPNGEKRNFQSVWA